MARIVAYLGRLLRFARGLARWTHVCNLGIAVLAALLTALVALCILAWLIAHSIWAWTPVIWWKIVLVVGLVFALGTEIVFAMIASQARDG